MRTGLSEILEPMAFEQHYAFRSKAIEAVIKDLIGPSAPEEVLDDPPITRYAAGILYARRSGNIEASQDNDADLDEDAEEGGMPDPPVALANVRYPSSLGITFAVKPTESPKLSIQIAAARYEDAGATHEKAKDGEDKATPQKPTRSRKKTPARWQRIPIAIPPCLIDVTKPFSDYVSLDTPEPLKLFCRVRPVDSSGAVPITVVLLNDNLAPETGPTDALAFFQPEIAVSGANAGTSPFVERPFVASSGSDEDIRSYRLLYRHAREFAAGHGCSVTWDTDPTSPDRASRIISTFAPKVAVPISTSNPAITLTGSSMLKLATGNKVDLLPRLSGLCDGYVRWIKARRDEAKTLTELNAEQRATAEAHMQECDTALERIRNGIKLLEKENLAWKAFQLANAAMLAQRARSVWLKTGKQSSNPIEDDTHEWRPFQLAFMLMCLPGIFDKHSLDREVADLLWFPTGGGKTEAYLGLIAFTVFLRRLRNKDGGGVTAIMRYTLRLLTIQQFERATLLICCCEDIRRRNKELGAEPISIGLWLGRGATPNSLTDTRTALNKLAVPGAELNEGNPIQIHSCPWCGLPLDRRNYWIATDTPRLVVSCRQEKEKCAFGKELPVHIVDDDVYLFRPTLIIATVDKFASLPWRDKSAALFNLADSRKSEQPRPELIIQDELHLISGPLGTLVGLYETAIDTLCTDKGVRPKIIASTATIRRAGQQTAALFDRSIRQFPPPGIDARDSYFAVQAPPDKNGDRLYLGLMAPGTSHTTLLVRTYAALLQNVAEIPGPPEVKDPYWTLVGYFNSLRVLGGARLQVSDDVNDRMELLATHHGTTKRDNPSENLIELTSREPSSKIPDHLKRMAVACPDVNALAVILATNMISVGVDIDRLGLMAVMGQPQTTSEYIQATSRVGRRFPGLVVIMLNAARSRDRSHYESFTAYHSALYRQVESTSVTPFSARARDRGLHAVVVALARLLEPGLRANAEAAKVANFGTRMDEIRKTILDRLERVRAKNAVDAEDVAATKQQLRQIVQRWTDLAADHPIVYSDYRNAEKSLLRDAAEYGPNTEDGFPTLWSLRDVDKDSNLFFARINAPQRPT